MMKREKALLIVYWIVLLAVPLVTIYFCMDIINQINPAAIEHFNTLLYVPDGQKMIILYTLLVLSGMATPCALALMTLEMFGFRFSLSREEKSVWHT